jgi:hypothetical protein
MDDKLTIIFTAATPIQARMLQNLLDDEGIQAYLVNDALQGAVGEVPFGWSTAVRVAVSSEQAEQAQAIARSFEQQLAHGGAGILESNEVVESVSWSTCPECGQPRTAVCAWCGTSGTQFPAADPEPAGAAHSEQPRWLCPTCDEPNEGRFLRWCEWCNHDFGVGVQAASSTRRAPRGELNSRVIRTFVALCGFVILLLIYLAIVLSR